MLAPCTEEATNTNLRHVDKLSQIRLPNARQTEIQNLDDYADVLRHPWSSNLHAFPALPRDVASSRLFPASRRWVRPCRSGDQVCEQICVAKPQAIKRRDIARRRGQSMTEAVLRPNSLAEHEALTALEEGEERAGGVVRLACSKVRPPIEFNCWRYPSRQ